MGMFRLWQPHEDAYMLAWNGLVAKHTAVKLSEKVLAPVILGASILCAENNLDPQQDENRALAN